MKEPLLSKLPIFGDAGPYLKYEYLSCGDSQVSPAYSSGKSSSKMKVNVKKW